jgi:hypothetical protein
MDAHTRREFWIMTAIMASMTSAYTIALAALTRVW